MIDKFLKMFKVEMNIKHFQTRFKNKEHRFLILYNCGFLLLKSKNRKKTVLETVLVKGPRERPLKNSRYKTMGMISAVGLKLRVQYDTKRLPWQELVICFRGNSVTGQMIMNSSFGGNCLEVLTFPASGRASYLLFC